jgi:hypothetical protein
LTGVFWEGCAIFAGKLFSGEMTERGFKQAVSGRAKNPAVIKTPNRGNIYGSRVVLYERYVNCLLPGKRQRAVFYTT